MTASQARALLSIIGEAMQGDRLTAAAHAQRAIAEKQLQ